MLNYKRCGYLVALVSFFSINTTYAVDSSSIGPKNLQPTTANAILLTTGTGIYFCGLGNSAPSKAPSEYNGQFNCSSQPITPTCPPNYTPVAQVAFTGNDSCKAGSSVEEIIMSPSQGIVGSSGNSYNLCFNIAYASIEGLVHPNTMIWVAYSIYCVPCSGSCPSLPSCPSYNTMPHQCGESD